MCISTTTISGIKITFDTKKMPLTSGLKNLITGKAIAKPKENVAEQVAPIKRLLTITRGQATPQMSCIEAFSARKLSHEDDVLMSLRKYWNAKAKKTKGKKPARMTVRGVYLN